MRGALGALLVALLTAGCTLGAYEDVRDIPDDPAPPGAKEHFGMGILSGRSPYTVGEAPRIVAELRRALGRSKIECTAIDVGVDSLSLTVHRGGGELDSWSWRRGTIEGPTPRPSVDEKGLAEQLFELSDVPWADLAGLRLKAKRAVVLERGRVGGTDIRRTDGSLRVGVSIEGLRRSATIGFDAKGHVVDVPDGVGPPGAPPPFRWRWDSGDGPPILTSVPRPDGTAAAEGFLGRIYSPEHTEYWVALIDGSDFNPLWKAGPFGAFDQGCYRWTHVAVVAHDVVVTDCRGTAHVYDLASGREARTVELGDRAASVCPAQDVRPRVWIELNSAAAALVDAELGKVTPGPRPPSCPARTSDECSQWYGRPAHGCKLSAFAPKVAGFTTTLVIDEGDLAVAFGRTYDKRTVFSTFGFDPATKAVRWQHPIAPGDPSDASEENVLYADISSGRFAAAYLTAARQFHIAMFDARSGERLWDIEARRPYFRRFTLSPSRLYVEPSSDGLDVYDAKTGAFIGKAGRG